MTDLTVIMDEYYKTLDLSEDKRMHDQARLQYLELKERAGENWV